MTRGMVDSDERNDEEVGRLDCQIALGSYHWVYLSRRRDTRYSSPTLANKNENVEDGGW